MRLQDFAALLAAVVALAGVLVFAAIAYAWAFALIFGAGR